MDKELHFAEYMGEPNRKIFSIRKTIKQNAGKKQGRVEKNYLSVKTIEFREAQHINAKGRYFI
jgi:hypothetical protein